MACCYRGNVMLRKAHGNSKIITLIKQEEMTGGLVLAMAKKKDYNDHLNKKMTTWIYFCLHHVMARGGGWQRPQPEPGRRRLRLGKKQKEVANKNKSYLTLDNLY